jgi:hypothetical protein
VRPQDGQAPRAGVGAGSQAWLVPAGSWGAARRFFLRVNPWEGFPIVLAFMLF